MKVNEIICGDCLDVLKTLDENSVDSVVTDPPYGLGFMGKEWDTFDDKFYAEKEVGGWFDWQDNSVPPSTIKEFIKKLLIDESD